MAFSSPANADWAQVDFLNEIVAAIRERETALGWSSLTPLVAAGDDVQAVEFLAGLQALLTDDLVPMFCNHTFDNGAGAGDYTGMDELPMWQATQDAADSFIFEAMQTGQKNWRRKTVTSAWATEGTVQAGDIIGPWIFEDMQRLLVNLLWVRAELAWSARGETNQKVGYGSYQTSSTPRDDAEAEYDASGASVDMQPVAYTYDSWPNQVVLMHRAYAYLGSDALPAVGGNCALDIYFRTWRIPATPPLDEFDDNGDGLSEYDQGIGTLRDTGSYAGAGTFWNKYGDDTIARPAWCAQADQPPNYEPTTSKGYEADANGAPFSVLHAGDSFTWK